MTLPTKPRGFGISQFVIVTIVIVSLFFAWGFWQRVLDTMQLAREDAQTEQLVRQEQQANAQLQQLKKDVATNEWVEKYCRTQLHCARDNETIIMPLTTPTPTPAGPAPTPAPSAPAAPPFWQQWLNSLFGPSP